MRKDRTYDDRDTHQEIEKVTVERKTSPWDWQIGLKPATVPLPIAVPLLLILGFLLMPALTSPFWIFVGLLGILWVWTAWRENR